MVCLHIYACVSVLGDRVLKLPTLCQSEFGTAALCFSAGRIRNQSIRQAVNSKLELVVHIRKVYFYEILNKHFK